VTTCAGALAHAAACATLCAADARTARRRACEHADEVAAVPGVSEALLARADAAAARAADHAAQASADCAAAHAAARAGRAALDGGDLEYAGRCAGLVADWADHIYAAAHGAEAAEDDARDIARRARRGA
jgi:hypothetical protein